jgi:hypothetical protein
MNELEKIELNCRRLLACKTSEERSDVLKESVGYLGLAKAYVELSDIVFNLCNHQEVN